MKCSVEPRSPLSRALPNCPFPPPTLSLRCTILSRRTLGLNIQDAVHKTGCGKKRCLVASLGTSPGHVSGPSGFTRRKSSASTMVMPLTLKRAHLVIPDFVGPNQLAIETEVHLLVAHTPVMGSGGVPIICVGGIGSGGSV